MKFPVDLSQYNRVALDPSREHLTDGEREQLLTNINVCRDALIFFTGYAGAKGLGGHTGGPYDIVPEIVLVDSLMKRTAIYPVFFDEAGHRVAIQYLMAALKKELPVERLFHYREYSKKNPLPGHPEIGITDGVKFSSGRLGHMWSFVNGIARAHPDQAVILFGSDGSQQEGNDAEAARFSVAHGLNVKVIVDDNNVTISGHPHEYMKGYDVEKTLQGHGLRTVVCNPENIDELYGGLRTLLSDKGPVALINRRVMAPGVPGIEGKPKGHDVVSAEHAMEYLEGKGLHKAAAMIKKVEKIGYSYDYLGSSSERKKNRSEFGKIVVEILDGLSDKDRKKNFVIDCDLEGSTGLNHIREKYPTLFVLGGVMERHNYAAAAGFGFDSDTQGIFATFSAFSEMVISEITMARLNHANVLAHFSHAGIDYISDNTCHFGMNVFFTDNGVSEEGNTRLYFPADANQLKAVLKKIFFTKGLRFVFSTRSATPMILDEKGDEYYKEYRFSEKDDVIREGKGFVISYGACLYRALDAVERLKKNGVDVGLVNKGTLNVVDSKMMKKLAGAPFVLVVEDQNVKTGLGVRFGTWLLEHGFSGKYAHLGTTLYGHGGQEEQMFHQGLDSKSIQKAVKKLQG